MPRNIKLPLLGGVTVSGHRGSIIREWMQEPTRLRQALQQPKDKQPQSHLTPPRRGPIPRMPTVSVEPTTHCTRYASPARLARAAARSVPAVDSLADLVTQVRTHIAAKLQSREHADKPLLVLLGECHGTVASTMISLTTIAHFRGAKVLFECNSAAFDRFMDDVRARDRDLRHSGREGNARLTAGLRGTCSPAARQRVGLRLAAHIAQSNLVAIAAVRTGGAVAAFDPIADEASSEPEREGGMIGAIRQNLDASPGPVIVTVGMHHLPVLLEAFKGTNDVVAISSFSSDLPPAVLLEPNYRRRMSYQLSSPDVLAVRTTPAFDAERFSALGLARAVGIDLV